MAETERLVVELEARVAKFEKSFERASRTADRRWRQIEGHGKRSGQTIEASFTKTATSIQRSASAASAALLRMGTAIGLALSVREVVQAADAWQSYQNKLKAAGVPTEQVATTLNRMTEIALRTRSELGAVTDLFSKLTLVSEQYNLTADQAARITETVSKAMKAGGASAQEQASAILQLSQAIGSGVLQGDELRSLRENAPLLLKAIAKELKVTTGEMKRLGEEGKLTGDVILRSLLNASGEIDAAFGKTIPTLSDGFTNMTTSFTALIGEFDRGAGISKELAKALASTSASLDDLRASAAGWGAIIAENAERAIAAVKPLYDLINAIAKYSPTGLLAQRVGGADEYSRGVAMLKRGLGSRLSQDPDSLYDFGGSTGDASNIKAPAKDYTKKTGDLLDQIQRRTEALRVEADMFGRSTYAIERARAAQELLSRAKSAGIPITDTLRQKIEATASAYAQEAARLEALKTAQQTLNELRSTATEFASGFAKDLSNGVSATEALGNALDRLKDKLIDLASSKLIDIVFNVGTSGTSGLFSQLFGHAEGGLIRGPRSPTSDSIVTRVSAGEYIVNAQQTGKYLDLLNAINSGKSLRVPNVGNQIVAPQMTNNLSFSPTIHVSGGTPEQNQDAADRIGKQLETTFKEFFQKQAIKEMRYGGLFNSR